MTSKGQHVRQGLGGCDWVAQTLLLGGGVMLAGGAGELGGGF